MAKTDIPKYRADIDGIRGIAVLLVVAFHASAKAVTGGFVGVDVFFVISGYLISSIIFAEISDGRFSIARFYERRIRRIFPSLITVLLGILILGWFVLWAAEFRNLGKHVVGGAAFISNVLLWRETGYFAEQAEFKPLLHLWSLGVEEQFYIFFPVGIWLVHRLRPASVLPALVIVFAASLAACLFGTQTHPSATFYLPMTRLWELMLGAMLASVQKNFGFRPKAFSAAITPTEIGTEQNILLNLASLLGLGLVIGSALFINESMAFPGGWALLPTIGTVLMIAAGKDVAVNRWLLGNKLIVGVGLISYPLYLWHWPALFLTRIVMNGNAPWFAIVATVAVSGALAFLTYWHIERPIRFKGALGARTAPVLCSAMAAVLLIGLCANRGILPSRLGASALQKQVTEAIADWAVPFTDNFKKQNGFVADPIGGAKAGGRAVLFIGDSHMQQYWPRVKFAQEHFGSNACPVIFATAGGSPALPGVNRLERGFACDRFFEFAMQQAAQTNVGTVVFCCYWEGYLLGRYPDGPPADIYRVSDQQKTPLRLGSPGADQVLSDFGHAIRTFTSSRKRVFVLLSAPESRQWDPQQQSRLAGSATADRLGVAQRDFDAFARPLEQKLTEIVLTNGGSIINPRAVLAEDGFFYGRSPDGEFRYKDGHHMRPFYVREKAVFIDALIEAR